MIYFCADDYGISKESNSRIEKCIQKGVLNKISVLPNGELEDFKERLSKYDVKLSLHINLVEGKPLSPTQDINLLVNNEGNFKYSFIGLLLLSLSFKRKEFKNQLYKEIKEQIVFWQKNMGENPLWIDSHQHTHMIPLVFKTLMKVIKDENIEVENIRIPSEPISPYILTPSLYTLYSPSGIIKQWVLKIFGFVNSRKFKRSNIPTSEFLGVMFSGRVTEEIIDKLLPSYLKIAESRGKDIEITSHPGYLEKGECLMDGCRDGFKKFYFSPWRKKEYKTLIDYKFKKEG